jgi:DNA ligase-1
MADATVMLAREYDPKKVVFPVQVTEKLDGFAADFHFGVGQVVGRSRQDKPYQSVDHICKFLYGRLQHRGWHLIGELTVAGVPDFKEAGGIIRRQETDERIRLNVYDWYTPRSLNLTYSERMKDLALFPELIGGPVAVIPGKTCWNAEEVEAAIAAIFERNPNAEGAMIRGWGDVGYLPGKRSWNMMRYKPKPTMDLPVHSFEEAVSGDGAPLGMVGRINVNYNGPHYIGVGPGKFTHEERKEMWRNRKKYVGKILEVQYMRDPGYAALRQPTAQRWRPDKDV